MKYLILQQVKSQISISRQNNSIKLARAAIIWRERKTDSQTTYVLKAEIFFTLWKLSLVCILVNTVSIGPRLLTLQNTNKDTKDMIIGSNRKLNQYAMCSVCKKPEAGEVWCCFETYIWGKGAFEPVFYILHNILLLLYNINGFLAQVASSSCKIYWFKISKE